MPTLFPLKSSFALQVSLSVALIPPVAPATLSGLPNSTKSCLQLALFPTTHLPPNLQHSHFYAARVIPRLYLKFFKSTRPVKTTGYKNTKPPRSNSASVRTDIMSMLPITRRAVFNTGVRITSARSIQPFRLGAIRLNSSSSTAKEPAQTTSAPPTPSKSSTTSPAANQEPASYNLFTQIYPIDKDQVTESDVDEWLLAVKKLKASNNQNASTPEEVYLQELTQQAPQTLLNDEFEPTEQQQAEADAVKGTAIPLFQHPAIDNFVGLLMKDGKRSKYQKILNRALYLVYLKKRQDPIEILVETLDKLGPLMATRTEKTGFAKNRIVPYPLNQRQRNRFAIKWIMEGASKKKSSDYSVRLAEEIMATHEGKSAGYDKKAQMHKTAILQRSYVSL